MKWENVTLGQLVDEGEVEIQTGPFGTQLKASDYVVNGIPVINVRNIGYGLLHDDKLEFISDQTAERLGRHSLMKDDIVFGRKGAVDRHLLVRDKEQGWLQGSDCIRLRVITDKLRSHFLSYQLLTPYHKQWILNQSGNKSTMASLNQDVIKRISLFLPNTHIQDQIVDVLKAYDSLIENNRRRIELLEQAARLLYKEWFVHFRFPGHEHVKIVDGVPEGWVLGNLEDFYDTSSGGTPSRKNSNYYGGEINWIKTQELNGGFIFSSDETISEEGLRSSSAKLFNPGTVLLAMYGATIGQVAILAVPSSTNQACCAIMPLHECASTEYMFLFLKEYKESLKGLAQGSAQNNISQQIIRNIRMCLPDRKVMKLFSDYCSPLLDKIRVLEAMNIKLTQARDLLLPRLMNGEIAI